MVVSYLSSDVSRFLDGGKVSKLVELLTIEENSIAYVIGCYFGVVEGVDVVYDDETKVIPRLCLKINVGDDVDDFEFVLYGEIVKKVAPLTCVKLLKENASSTLYPDEIDEMFGDPMLFKVRKEHGCDSCGSVSVEFLDVLFHSNLLEIYLNPGHVAYSTTVTLDDPVISPVVEAEILRSDSCESKIGQVIVPSIPLVFSSPVISSSLKSSCLILYEFIGSNEVKRLSDLFDSKDGSTVIVFGWYDSVCEGVDTWYSGGIYLDQPRFRLKINVRDEYHQTTLVLFDEQVKKLAFETCGVLVSIGESSSVYPDEMDDMYGDSILFKVRKKSVNGRYVSSSYEVVDMLSDPLVLDKFRQYYMPTYGVLDCPFGKLSPFVAHGESYSKEDEYSGEELPCAESKRKAEFICESSSLASEKKLVKHAKII
ncbi:hypothetical protein L195_g023893 [Trifolium pratense]|uniref:Uncharacterized protein n=1 Tax=Trifolium pratense TaxID=57577 RepID=A0A2K3NC54_TRIPR|nr:hypothetical protein L195_g023893 [Trifolium pratense]